MHGLRGIQYHNRYIPTPEKTTFTLKEYGDAETALAAAEGHLRGFMTAKPEARPNDYRIHPVDLSLDGLGMAYVISVVR